MAIFRLLEYDRFLTCWKVGQEGVVLLTVGQGKAVMGNGIHTPYRCWNEFALRITERVPPGAVSSAGTVPPFLVVFESGSASAGGTKDQGPKR
jgi:hypothetical protein